MKKSFLPIIYILVFIAIIFGGTLISLYTDWLWFSSLDYGVVFTTMLLSKIKLGLGSCILFFLIIYSNLWLARKISPPAMSSRMEQQLFEKLGKLAKHGLGIVTFLVSIVISVMVGLAATAYWQELLYFMHSTSFGVVDPLLKIDIGFYVFKLPMLNYAYNWFFFALVASTIATILLHYANESITLYNGQIRFARGVKTHISVLIALMFFLKAWGYRLNMYDLLNVQNRIFDGAGYTEANANLPMLWIMMALTIIGGIMVLLNIKRRDYKLVIGAFGGLIVASILLGGIYPTIVQELSVKPNELEKQTPYIARAIKATQMAFGIDNVAAREFAADTSITPQQIADNDTTIKNVRLWDKDHVQEAYNQTQAIQQYYHFPDVDVDRYWISEPGSKEKQYRQVWLAARELSQDSLDDTSQTWVNKQLQYTHGYGLVMSPINEVNSEGLPQFMIDDIPPRTTVDIPLEQMGVYFGQMTDTDVFVNTSAKEFDYPSHSTEYIGENGIKVGGFLKKLLFAFRFSDINILLNKNLKSDSQLLYKRNIMDRASSLLPFLSFDRDPYMVTIKGGMYWMLDGYTTTNAYPYSKSVSIDDTQFNYIRNSVKIIINAYSGKMDAYIIEKPLADPIINTYSKMFPGVFKPISEMPEEFKAHIRYPEDLFRIQTEIFTTYHMTEPTVFYNKSDSWEIPMKADLINQDYEESMEPYYVIMKLPNGESEEFILMTPYTRSGKKNMVSWMCAKCDGNDYGKLVLYQFPKDRNIFGPQQIVAKASQDTEISRQLSLWNMHGSKVSSGNLLVIPIDTSLLYVMPVYLESTSTKIPEMKRVVVALGGKIVMEPTLNEALASLIGAPVKASQAIGGSSANNTSKTGSKALDTAGGDVAKLINQASSQYDRAMKAQRNGDWASYGQAISDLKKTLNELQSRAR